MPLPPIVTSLTSGVYQTELTGAIVIGTIDQGDPNTGGADAWPVVDAPVKASVDAVYARVAPATPFSFVSANSNNANFLKASPGVLKSLAGFTIGAAPVYLKLYNKTSAPSPGSDTPLYVVMIPANATAALGAGAAIPLGDGLNFSVGIAYALVSGIAADNNGSVAAAESVISFGYV